MIFHNVIVTTPAQVILAGESHVQNLAVVASPMINDSTDMQTNTDWRTSIDMSEESSVDFMFADQEVEASGEGQVGIFAAINGGSLNGECNVGSDVVISDGEYSVPFENTEDGFFDELIEEVYQAEPTLDPDYEPDSAPAPSPNPTPTPAPAPAPVSDTTPPTFDDISDQTIDVGTASVDWTTYIKNASDNSGGTLKKSVVADSVVYGTSGTGSTVIPYQVTVKVTDPSGNSTGKSFNVEVSADTEKPTFDAIANQKIDVGTTDIDWTTYIQNESDNSCGTLLKSEFDDGVIYETSGTYKVSLDVDDPNGNTASQTFDVVVEADTEKPMFDAIPDQNIDVGTTDIDWTTYIQNETDNSCGVLAKTEFFDGVT